MSRVITCAGWPWSAPCPWRRGPRRPPPFCCCICNCQACCPHCAFCLRQVIRVILSASTWVFVEGLLAFSLIPLAALLLSSASFLLLPLTVVAASRTLPLRMFSAFQPDVLTLGWARHRAMQLAFPHLASIQKLNCRAECASPHGLPSSSSLSRSTTTLDFTALIIVSGCRPRQSHLRVEFRLAVILMAVFARRCR